MNTEPIIVLMDEANAEPLRKWRATQTVEFGLPMPVTSLVAGTKYKIVTVGDTDFTGVGAANSDIGTIFTATGAGTGTGTAVQMVTRYNVKSGKESDILKFMVWNNRKSNEVVDLEIKSGCSTAGDVTVKLNGVDYTAALTVNGDTDVIATAIKEDLELDSEFTAAWEAQILPAVKFDGVTVRNTILSFKAKDFEPKGECQFVPGTTGVDTVMTVMIKGNPATETVSKITDAKIYIKDDQGNITSDIVRKKWGYIKNEADAQFVNIGVDINEQGETTEYSLDLKAMDSSVALGEILGGVNTGDLADDTNYDKLAFYMKPPAEGVAQGIRQWKLVITYNFT